MTYIRIQSVALLLCAALSPALVHAQNVLETPPGSSVERDLPGNRTFTQWVRDPGVLGTQASDRVESRAVPAKTLETVKLKNVVPPIHFESGVAKIPDSTVAELRKVLARLRGRKNLRLHLVGHADSQPLSPALAAIFGDNEGLSRERAGEAAEFLQRALGLPPEAIDYEWAGDTQPIASNATPEGRAMNRRVEVEVWYDRVKDTVAHEEVLVKQDFKQIKVCRTQTVCRLTYVEGHERRTRLKNVVAPLHFDADEINVPAAFIDKIRQALKSMAARRNVLVKFIGYTDDSPLTGRNKRIYATQVGLSKARARRVALAVQEALHLPTAAIASDGQGAARPLGSNETAQGRALNRRVEVEFWYDDPLQELPDEPQMCPTPDTEIETRVYDPPWGKIPPLQIENGQPNIPAGYAGLLRRALADVADKKNARLRFVGYTGNHPLERRTALDYGDDIGLSAARARRAMEAIVEQLKLDPKQAEFEGRGYVQSDDVVNSGFTQGKRSYVVVQIVYDEVAQLDDQDGVNVTPITREIETKNAFGLNPMHITVDGKPIDDKGRSSEDIQRCTDVALDRANIRFGFDALSANRRLAVAAQPATIEWRAAEHGAAGETVRFSMYANYSHYIQRAEVRIFGAEQSLEAKPLDVVPIGPDGFAEWQPKPRSFTAPSTALKYVLRAYGKSGAFDETLPQPLRIVYADDDRSKPAPPARSDAATSGPDGPADAAPAAEPAAKAGRGMATAPGGTPEQTQPAPGDSALVASAYGQSNLGIANIPVASGTVTVRGSAIPKNHTVWVAGRRVPVDADGAFSAQEILPSGMHTVEVAVLDDSGNGKLYLRDLELERKDWFYVGMADLTLSHNDTNGPMDQLQGANSPVAYDSSADGRLAFYVNGKFSDAWRLTASADTQDEPLKNLFSNFLDKSPDALFRRIDPNYHYPTFGDDATVQEMAPTLGKFYVKVAHRDNYGLWGNFKVAYMDNELAQVDRGLYGADLHYQSQATTSFGEQRFAVDGFTAEPGTIASREEFRGTGGSLYFLHRQDILQGSERVRIEIRDRVSGLVKSVKDLTPGIDYDIDYLQGRIVLAEPLASTANDNLLVRSSGLQGDETYLVVRYEYSPGFDQLNALSTGTQVHYWIKDRVKLGLTANANDQGSDNSSLDAADVTVRISSDSWFKLQRARTQGLIGSTAVSNDGGFAFSGYDDASFTGSDARGYRADVSLGMSDFLKHADGRLTLYTQSLDGGYSAPGLATLTDTRNYGGTFRMPVTKKVSVRAKADRRVQDAGLETNAQELDVAYRITGHWGVSTGLRKDERIDRSPVVPLTQTQGEREDAVVQMEYDSKARWSAYGFVQDTLSATGDRAENARVGTGASYRFSDRLKINAEASSGDLGPGGKFGAQYMPTDRTTLYANYSLESEQLGTGLLGSTGTSGGSNVTAGMKTRLSDSSSVYVEERYRNNTSASGMTHATGFSLAPTDRLKFGASTELGTLRDALTGAETKRRAAALQVGYGFGALQLATGIEYRYDQTEQPDTSFDTRRTVLLRNNLKYQITPGSRLIGKFDRSVSASSLGQFYDGGYTEAVIGYAYRPVRNDRLNALFKYTYLYNVPTTEQLTLKNTAAEFIQKSHVAAFDVTYDLTARWSLGGKYAHRRGQMSLDRIDPAFFDNAADLYVLRADFRFKETWEGLIEGRMLDMPDVRDQRSGALLVISRYLNSHIKLGVGYNFTDFSDDLTDLSFDHRGVFVNMTGAL